MQPNLQPQADPVAEAIARRGMGAGAPAMEAPAMASPAPTLPSPSTGAPMGAPQPEQKFVPKDGHEFVLTTLAEQLKNDHKLEMEKLKFNTPMMGR